jgi:uncharacterized membrane protein
MTNAPSGGEPPPFAPANFLNSPQLVYLLYFGGFLLAVLPLIGLVVAYVNRDGASELDRSHYDFQISTFWRGLAILAVGVITAFFLIGWLVILFWAVWTIVRNVKGLSAYGKGQPMAATPGWGFG